MTEFLSLCVLCALGAIGAGPAVAWSAGGITAVWIMLMIISCLLADALHDLWKFLDRF